MDSAKDHDEFATLNARVRLRELQDDAKRTPEDLLEETLRLSRFASELGEAARRTPNAPDVRT